jgi:hypothetical protein
MIGANVMIRANVLTRGRILSLTMAATVLLQVLTGELQGEILDRIAVTVAKQVITERDVIRDLRVSAFLDQKPVDLSGPEKRKAADRLVDQLLILQEIGFSRLKIDAEEDVTRMRTQLKLQYNGDSGYQAALVHYGVTETDVADHLMNGARALRFTDLRFRPEVEITDDDLRDAYKKFVEEGRKKGETSIPTFDAAHDDLEKLLTGERIIQGMDRWLGAQRTQTQILYRDQVFK